MRYTIFLLFLIFFCGGCKQNDLHKNVGDIPFDASIDNVEFEICDEKNIKQYYVRHSSDKAPGYKGEKRGLTNIILDAYKYPRTANEDGYITIRFIVNCKGSSGRFRIEEMDFNYQPKKFKEDISNQLLKIVKTLNGWTPRISRDKPIDFYQYLTFKMKNGQIMNISP